MSICWLVKPLCSRTMKVASTGNRTESNNKRRRKIAALGFILRPGVTSETGNLARPRYPIGAATLAASVA